MRYIKPTNFFVCFMFVLIMGYLFIIGNNIDRYSLFLKQKIEIAIFLKPQEKNFEVVEEKIRALDNVNSVRFISKEDIKEKLIKYNREILITLTNPFPNSYSVVPKEFDTKKIESLCNRIREINSVNDLKYDPNIVTIVENLKLFTKFTKSVSRLVIFTLFVGLVLTLFINMQRLINLLNMKYMDMVIGFIGSILGIICLKLLSIIISQVNTGFLLIKQVIILLISGICISIVIGFNDIINDE